MVGLKTSLFSLGSLMGDGVAGMESHVDKLIGSDHPILRTIKRLAYHFDQNNLQVSVYIS